MRSWKCSSILIRAAAFPPEEGRSFGLPAFLASPEAFPSAVQRAVCTAGRVDFLDWNGLKWFDGCLSQFYHLSQIACCEHLKRLPQTSQPGRGVEGICHV